MYQEELKIPKDRIAILIGKKGLIKKRIELRTKTKLKIDSIEGDVIISGDDPVQVYDTKNLIRAIGRGFNPDIAFSLLNEEILLEVIDIQEICGKSKNKQLRAKARVIGTEGKSRHLVERLTNTDISVYGKTVSIIGNAENAFLARRVVEMLLHGSKHGNVYFWLEKQLKNRRLHRI